MIKLKITIISILFLFTTSAFAVYNFNNIDQLMKKNKYSKATVLLNKINDHKNSNLKSQILLRLGICQYMLGDLKQSRNSFSTAKGYQSTIKLDLRLVFNHKNNADIKDFFNSIAATPIKSYYHKKGTAFAIQKPTLKKKLLITTVLRFRSKVLANITIDGKLHVDSDNIVQTVAGLHNLVITAKGYNTQKMSINVAKGAINTVKLVWRKKTIDQDKRDLHKVAHKTTNKKHIKRHHKHHKISKKITTDSKKEKADIVQNKPSLTSDTPVVTQDNWKHYMPFSWGNFSKGNYNLGITFAAIQGVGILGSIWFWIQSDQITTDANNEISQRNTVAASISDLTQRKAYTQESTRIYNDKENQANTATMISYVSFSIFVASWILDIVGSKYLWPQYNTQRTVKSSILPLYFDNKNEVGISIKPYAQKTRYLEPKPTFYLNLSSLL